MVRRKNRGFKALLATQFLDAFNDNCFKLVIGFIAVDRFVNAQGGSLFLSLSGVVFVLPFLLFSTYGGFLADHFSKKKVIVVTKVFELVVMALSFFALLNENIWVLLTVLFFTGFQSALFSPSKYAILPEILEDERLSEGNGLIQLWTYAAIILGQAAGGYLIDLTKPAVYKTAYFFMGISLLGIITSIFVTNTAPVRSERKFEWNFLGEIAANVKKIRTNRTIFLSMIGLMYFGFLGALFQLNILMYARKLMGITHMDASILLIILAVGMGAGSMLAGKLSDQKVELGLVPMGAVGLAFFSIILGFIYHSFVAVCLCLFLLGFSSGFFIVPLNALIQRESPGDRRGQILATNNFLSFAAILAGSGAVYMFRDGMHLNAAQIFMAAGLMTAVGTIYVCRLLPYALARFIVLVLTHTIYRIKAIDKDHVPQEGGALLVSNHVSMVDALLILVSIQRPIRFMVGRSIFETKMLNALLKLAKAIPIAGSDGPKEQIKSLHEAARAIKNGELVCIFAEGRLTRTGNILKFNRGLEHIVKNVQCPIIPVHLDRIWGSIFSFEGGKCYYKMPKVIPYPVTVTFGKPMPSDSSAFAIRNRVMELGAEAFQYRLKDKSTLPELFWKEARKHPKHFCMADASGKKLIYAKTLIGAVALADKLKTLLGTEQNIGIMIPPSVGGSLANIAVSLLHKVPVNLNYTSSKEALESVGRQCAMKYVLTSKAFLEKVEIVLPGEAVYLEDILASMTQWDRIKAAIKSYIYPRWISYWWIFGVNVKREMEDLATIMFTSGSTGEPKGVMLTHANVLSNLEGLYQVFHVDQDDVLMGVLPFFHSFGFTATMWFPLIGGVGAVYHTNPLDAKMIGMLAHKFKATIIMSTPTFLNAYTRRCREEQFKTLRIAVVGAEKLKENVARAFEEKFGIVPMEGYGCTELSPIVSISLPDFVREGSLQKAHKPGKIGMPLPGVAVKILDQETHEPKGPEENGLLFVKGPNVMKGYLNRPDITREVIEDGWYATGDVANLDEDGFLMITDRLSRFSKIGGEMVPHIKIEETVHNILGASEQMCVVTSIPDEKKGEKLTVLCLMDVDVPSLVEELRKSDLPNLWIPAADCFHKVNAIPLLGTGKIDLGQVKRIAVETFAAGDSG